MANLLIKPTTGPGNKVILQDQAGGDILTSADSGATIENAIITADTLTVTGSTGLGWRLLETQTSSDAGNIIIGSATTLSSTYDDYMIVGTSVRTHTAGSLVFRMTIGGSELSSAYLTVGHGLDSSATNTNVTSGNYQYAFINSGTGTNNNAYDRLEFKMYLSSPTSTVFQHKAWGIASYSTNAGYVRNSAFSARHNTTGALTAIKVYPGSGNISGTLKLYGLSK